MPDLSLPILDRSASAKEALTAMKEDAKSGVIAHSQGQFWLYSAGQVVVALSENPDVTLAEIQPTKELNAQLPPKWKTSAYSIISARYAGSAELVKGLHDIVFSVERDWFDALQASPQDCYCKVDGKPVAGGATGADCPDGHRGSVRCV